MDSGRKGERWGKCDADGCVCMSDLRREIKFELAALEVREEVAVRVGPLRHAVFRQVDFLVAFVSGLEGGSGRGVRLVAFFRGFSWRQAAPATIWPFDSLRAVAVGHERREVRGGDLAAVEAVPVDLGEPHVAEDVLGAARQVAEALGQVGGEEVLEQVPILGKSDTGTGEEERGSTERSEEMMECERSERCTEPLAEPTRSSPVRDVGALT